MATETKKQKQPAKPAGPIAYHPEATITCACGAVYKVGSTKPEVHVDICAKCHPLYTGVRKLVDEGGRVTKFGRRAERAKEVAATTGGRKQRVAKRAAIKASKQPKAEKE
jgi:large subunit ribosomal protein L31